jgi:uncharacterized membrane protein
MLSVRVCTLAQVAALSEVGARLLRGIALRTFIVAALFGTVIAWNSYAAAMHQGGSWWHTGWIWVCVFATAIVAVLNIRDAVAARENARAMEGLASSVKIYAKGRP